MEIPVYFKTSSYEGKINNNLINLHHCDENGYQTYWQDQVHDCVEITERPDNPENYLCVTIDSEQSDLENSEHLFDIFTGEGFQVDLENHRIFLNGRLLELPRNLYAFRYNLRKDTPEQDAKLWSKAHLSAVFWAALIHHYKIDTKQFFKHHTYDKIDSEHGKNFAYEFFGIGKASSESWKYFWICVIQENNQIVEVRSFKKYTTANNFAKKHLRENFRFYDEVKWNKGEIFVRDNTTISLIKETI